jgi:glycosyltransferase involved in cell wall biosynthesis
LRIVHVYKDIFPVLGGMENHVRVLCRELARANGLDVRILVTNMGKHTTTGSLDGVPVVRAGRMATVASTPISFRLPMELRRLRPDIIHLHVPYPVGEIASLIATPSVPTVITYHSDVVRQRTLLRFYGPVLKRVLRKASRILVTSEPYLESSSWLQPVRDHCQIVPLGIDLEPFTHNRPHSDGRTLLFVGRFRYYKGLQYLIDAMALLPDARLVLVGSGPLEEELRARVRDRHFEDRIEFAGNVRDEDLPRFYAEADAFVLPACERSEAFGLVLVEALASGLPCVSTELQTGTSYVNVNEETGYVVPPKDPEALAGACRRLLADAGLRRTLGEQARRRAHANFDIVRVAAQVARVYEEVGESDRTRKDRSERRT